MYWRRLAGKADAALRLLRQTKHEFGLRVLHLRRRQAGQHRLQIINDHAPDPVHIVPDGAGAMGGQNRVGGATNGMIGGKRLLREDVDGSAETAFMQELGKRVKVNQVGAADEDQDGVGPDQREQFPVEHGFVLN